MAAVTETRPHTGNLGGVTMPLIVAALSGGLLAQGAFYPRGQWYVGVLVALAVLSVLPARRSDLLAPPVLAAAALAAWAVAAGALRGHAGAGLRYALLLAGVLSVAYACRCLPGSARRQVLAGLTVVGVLVAALGWLGVVLHRSGWAWGSDGLWRAAGTLTYPNAAAAVCAMLALTLLGRPRTVPYALAATALIAGVGETLSRGGVLAFVVGLLVLGRAGMRAALAPVVGAAVIVVGLLPSMSVGHPANLPLAAATLTAGLVVGAAPRPVWALAALPPLLVLAFVPHPHLGGRLTLDSPDRTGALKAGMQVFADHPLVGAGPGLGSVGSGTGTFRYVHNEYVQVLAELGIVGLVLLATFLVTAWKVLIRTSAARAASAALAVQAGLDFLWHVPAIPLLLAALAGLALPEVPARAQHSERGDQ
jgi:O-antigen ligase